MADPLHRSSDVPEYDTYPASAGNAGSSRNDIKSNAGRPQSQDQILDADRELPAEIPILDPQRELERGETAGNGRLNRTAEQIGGALGQAVNQARRAPANARQRLHVVRNRAAQVSSHAAEDISTSASSLAENAQQKARQVADQAQQKARELGDNAQQKARDLARTAQEKARDLADAAEQRGRVIADKAGEIGDRVQQRAGEIKQQLDSRTRELRAEARFRADQVRLRGEHIIHERPLEALGCIAAGAFALGVILRIARSRNASGY
jgi:ElaB/YqjD/DUF883 family membrane-anchored ribosome-binding protein